MGLVLVTVKFGKEEAAGIEVLDCILPLDIGACIFKQSYGGIMILETSLEPDAAALAIMNCPTSLIRTITPVDAVVAADIKEITTKSNSLVGNVPKRLAVNCTRRGRVIASSRDVEVAVGKALKQSGHAISLSSPKLIVRIDIIGERATISVRNPDLLFKKV